MTLPRLKEAGTPIPSRLPGRPTAALPVALALKIMPPEGFQNTAANRSFSSTASHLLVAGAGEFSLPHMFAFDATAIRYKQPGNRSRREDEEALR